MDLQYDTAGFYDWLGKKHILADEKLKEIFEQSKKDNIPLDQLLIKREIFAQEVIAQQLADFLHLSYIQLSSVTIPESVKFLIPEFYARKYGVIAFDDASEFVRLAMINPQDANIVAMIEKKSGKKVRVYYTTHQDLEYAFRVYYTNLQESVNNLLLKDKNTKTYDVPIEKILDLIIAYGYTHAASDIHFEPEKELSQVRFRIDGILHSVLKLELSIHSQIIARVKVMSHLRTDEHFSAQDGKMQAQLSQENLDIRISIVPISHGEKCVMRLLSSHFRQFTLRNLGMTTSDLGIVTTVITRPHGMILATGPTGSGKSTTIYALLKLLNNGERNIATIEDPVEYDITGINQIQVNAATNLTFANGLRSILRQDPDILYVGEIRDNETADIAVNAALTGHLLLSTLHTNDAVTAIPRLLDMGMEPFLIASTVHLIIAQRLVRKICPHCRVSYVQEGSQLAPFFNPLLIKKQFLLDKQYILYRGTGCDFCHHSGYVGRIGIFEVLVISEKLKELVAAKATTDTLYNQARVEGLVTMHEKGIEKMLVGITSMEEVLRTTIS